MNGVFTFPGDRPFNAADPSTYPERLSIRIPVPAGVTSFTHSFAGYLQDKWKVTAKLTVNVGLRYDVDIFPFAQDLNPLLTGNYPVDRNNFQPRAGFAYNVDGGP
jgi:outer membrane receptor protein involved in Fe transport